VNEQGTHQRQNPLEGLPAAVTAPFSACVDGTSADKLTLKAIVGVPF
jgi:hypothetical protein